MDIHSIMRMARESLTGKWGNAILAFLIYGIILGSPGIFHTSGSLVTLILGGPFVLGAAIFSLSIARGQAEKIEMIFEGFQHFTTALVTYLLMVLYVILWSLLLIVPGIIAALSYSMAFYILADNRELKPQEALKQSREMMDGHKMDLFLLCLRFLLLSLLCILTLGIGFLWLIPYVNVTMATFYETINQVPPGTYKEKDFV